MCHQYSRVYQVTHKCQWLLNELFKGGLKTSPWTCFRRILLLHRACCYDYFPYSNSCTPFIHFKNHQFMLILKTFKNTLKNHRCPTGKIIWLAVNHSITFLLLPNWYTNFLFIYTNYIKLNSSTCFERNPLIIRTLITQIVRMQPLVSSLSASDCLVQPLRQDSVLSQ
jgi:hypothetical protein